MVTGKWTDEIVELLITTISHVEEDALSFTSNSERNFLFIP